MKWIYDLSYEMLKTEFAGANLKKFTTDQVFQWLYFKNIQDVNLWSNISKTDRQFLESNYNTSLIGVVRATGDEHGTRKFLLELHDKLRIEAVLIPEKHHFTFCISTQAGCPLACRFCATGLLGFKRNLTAGEIISQILVLKNEIRYYTGKLNIVLMGMGEPLLNYENLEQALKIMTSAKAMNISPRNITISTSGILEPLKRFEKTFPRVKISFSLNASDDLMRETLMPISKKEKLADILDYFRDTKLDRIHRITFEYVLLKGVNDSTQDARKVAALLRGIPCKINVIPYNRNESLPFKTPSEQEVNAFADYLHEKGYTVIVRWSKGKEIRSACGQLAGEE